MSQRYRAADPLVTEVQPGFTEYAFAMGEMPGGGAIIRLIRRTSSSAVVVGTSISRRGFWSESELRDVMNSFEASVTQHLILTKGLQLTLPHLS
jgi:hypothetical protein